LAGIERARILAEELRRIAEDTRATLESASKLFRLEPFPLDVLTDAPSLISLLPASQRCLRAGTADKCSARGQPELPRYND
jgi:hypothetical protein